MKEVLLLCWRDSGHPQGGGSERYLEQVGAGLAERGIRVTLRTASYPGALRTEMRDGIRISRGGGRFSVYPLALAAIAFGRLGIGPLAGIQPDAVIDTQNGIPFFARMVSTAPVTVLVHHGHREQWPVVGPLMAKLGWWLESVVSPRVHRSNQYLTVSLPSADELVSLGVQRGRIAVVRNGVDPIPVGVAAGSGRTRTAHPSLSVLSRLVPHKQIEDALAAVAALRHAIPGLHLDIIGGGWWDQNLTDRTLELGIADAVTFHGHTSEARKHELLARSWLHVMPSRKEGWGLAVVEAAQHGVPTIGYRSSKGLSDSIIDGVTGVLVGPETLGPSVFGNDRDVGALTVAIEELLLDADLRIDMGEKARSRAREFSWSDCAAGVSAVLSANAAGTQVSGLIGPSLPGPFLSGPDAPREPNQ